MARTTNPTEFMVQGTGLFPFDMLRYDQCWPKLQEDAATIERTTRRRTGGPHRVTLMTWAQSRPTGDRWSSFGWKVVSNRRHANEGRFPDGVR